MPVRPSHWKALACLSGFWLCLGTAWSQEARSPNPAKPLLPALMTGNNLWPSKYQDTLTYTCPKATYVFRRTFDSVHRLTDVEQVVGDRTFASPELKASLEGLGSWRQTFLEASDCTHTVDGLSLLIRAIQLATPNRPQSEVKSVAFVLRAGGGITLESDK